MKKSLLLMMIIIVTNMNYSSAQDVKLVKDFLSGKESGLNSCDLLTACGNSMILSVNNENNKNKLYLTDGTPEGTNEIFDLGNYKITHYLTVDKTAYLIAQLGDEKYSLLKVNENNYIVDTILSNWYYMKQLLIQNDKVIFYGQDIWNKAYLYSLDIQTDKITQLTEVDWFHDIKDITLHNNDIYYISGNDNGKLSLFKFNTSNKTNTELYDFKTFDNYYSKINMTSAGNFVYFFYLDLEKKYSLFRTDGTKDGTIVLLHDFVFPSTFSFLENNGTISYKDKFYFRGRLNDGSNTSLFVSDGTTAGTIKILLDNPSETAIAPFAFRIFKDELYLSSSYNLLKLKPSGILLTKVFADNAFGADIKDFGKEFIIFSDSLCFIGRDKDGINREIILSKGTATGSKIIKMMYNNKKISFQEQIFAVNKKLFFKAYHEDLGNELFVYSPYKSSKTENTEPDNKITAYPDPAIDRISFDTEVPVKEIKIFDIIGREIHTYKSIMPNTTLNINFLNRGTYIYKLFSDDKIYTGKFYKL